MVSGNRQHHSNRRVKLIPFPPCPALALFDEEWFPHQIYPALQSDHPSPDHFCPPARQSVSTTHHNESEPPNLSRAWCNEYLPLQPQKDLVQSRFEYVRQGLPTAGHPEVC